VTTQHAVDEAGIRQHIDKVVEAIRVMDLEGMTSIYAPDMVLCHVQLPLQHVGAAATWRNWSDAFTAFQRPLGIEIRNLTITLDGDVAFAHRLNRLGTAWKNGNRSDFWVRATYCFRKINGKWLIAHHHASVPLDLENGRALLNLKP